MKSKDNRLQTFADAHFESRTLLPGRRAQALAKEVQRYPGNFEPRLEAAQGGKSHQPGRQVLLRAAQRDDVQARGKPQERGEMLLTSGFMSINFSGNMGVIKTRPGYASSLAYNIDNGGLPSIIGTIAGDDTIFIVIKDGEMYAT